MSEACLKGQLEMEALSDILHTGRSRTLFFFPIFLYYLGNKMERSQCN